MRADPNAPPLTAQLWFAAPGATATPHYVTTHRSPPHLGLQGYFWRISCAELVLAGRHTQLFHPVIRHEAFPYRTAIDRPVNVPVFPAAHPHARQSQVVNTAAADDDRFPLASSVRWSD